MIVPLAIKNIKTLIFVTYKADSKPIIILFLHSPFIIQPMPSNANRQFLDFEKPIKDLIETIEKYKHDSEKNKMDMSEPIRQLEESIIQKRKEITQHLTSWQRVQLSRHPDRPYTMKYIEKMTKCFLELYGDRNVKDDKA
jgi:acetyl-CoA carboxylase carboxyl transferase subunit alpha